MATAMRTLTGRLGQYSSPRPYRFKTAGGLVGWALIFATQRLDQLAVERGGDGRDRVGFPRSLVAAHRDDSCKSQCHPARVLRTSLNIAIRHLDDDLWTDEYRAVRLVELETLQPFGHLAKIIVGKSLESLADLDERSGPLVAGGEMVVREPSVAASIAPVGRDDYEVERARRLYLDPAAPAHPRHIGTRQRLGHHALVSRRHRARVELLTFCNRSGDNPAGEFESRGGREIAQDGVAFLVRTIDHQRPIEGENIEEKEPRRLLGTQALDLAQASEAAHQFLERKRAPFGINCDHFPIEDRLPRPHLLNRLDYLRKARGDLIETAGEDMHASVRTMDLHARTIELMLERDFVAEHAKRLRHVRHGMREHRLEWLHPRRGARRRRLRDPLCCGRRGRRERR